MGVDYQVWNLAALGEWHIRGRDDQADDALLAVPRCELVPELWYPLVSRLPLGEPIAVDGLGEDHRVHYVLLVRPHGHGGLPPLLRCDPKLRRLLQEPRRGGLPDED